MCTVTFIPVNGRLFITSSRDENASRSKALIPAAYQQDGVALLYPKDTVANGSWIALNQNGNAAVLLNGAFIKHEPISPYRKSRGLIFLDIIAHPQPKFFFTAIELDNIEPFTLVLFVNSCLYECRWDGKEKYCKQMDESRRHIWSSATLYAPAIISSRKNWFAKWITETDSPTQETIFNFHRFAGDGDNSNSILMNRGGKMLTVSITGIELDNDKGIMQYFDVAEKKTSCTILELEEQFVQN